jgi:hypothetical protein
VILPGVRSWHSTLLQGLLLAVASAVVLRGAPVPPKLAEAAALAAEKEAWMFTPPGFSRAGVPAVVDPAAAGHVRLVVRDAATGRPTACRVNVVGADGNYYQPAATAALAEFSMPRAGPVGPTMGNRTGMGPFRYWGHFFYSPGESVIDVPPGGVRIEVWKGLEYAPVAVTHEVERGGTIEAAVTLSNTAQLAGIGYIAGESHFHLPRRTAVDDEAIFALLASENLRFGAALSCNVIGEDYPGTMSGQLVPQLRGLGRASLARRDGNEFVSGQEYRTRNYGHLNFHLLDTLVMAGRKFSPDNWPLYGSLGRAAQQAGGFAIYAHGGYDKEIYADAALGTVDAVELLQFGEYRGIKLAGWYDMLNAGYRFACVAGSDYPFCRKFADEVTFVRPDGAGASSTFVSWLQGAVAGRSFVSTAPLLLLEVDGAQPGDTLRPAAGQTVSIRVRVRSEVAGVRHLAIVANGREITRLEIPVAQQTGQWVELKHDLRLDTAAWIAARAWGEAPDGRGDVEAHTNPVYCYVNGRRPYIRESVERWQAQIDRLMTETGKRQFAEKGAVLAYFQHARDVLEKIKQHDGLAVETDPRNLAGDIPPPVPPGLK